MMFFERNYEVTFKITGQNKSGIEAEAEKRARQIFKNFNIEPFIVQVVVASDYDKNDEEIHWVSWCEAYVTVYGESLLNE
jgi:hypothetical protein